MNGTETVVLSSSTAYRKERQAISRSDLAVGDVVQVAGSPASSGSSSSPQPPGTGTVDAKTVTVVEPTFSGRVLADRNGTMTLVGPEGQLLTVSTSGSTRYYEGTSTTSASAVSDGSHVMAEGTRTSITHLNADLVALMPAPGHAPRPPSHPSAAGPASSAA